MSIENEQLTRIKRLTQSLIISGFINIFLISLFFYWLINEIPPRPYCELKPADLAQTHTIDQSNAETIRNFKTLSFEQLKAKLTHTKLVENGYMQRDLALALMVAFHHFDLSKALLGFPQPNQQRMIAFGTLKNGKTAEIVAYPGLSDQQYQAIIHYANTERWPMTSKGLFLLMRKYKSKVDPTLMDAFFLTPEFLAVETLFNRSDVAVGRAKLLSIIFQGNWKMLSDFVERQRTSQDLSPANRQNFLLEYINNRSKEAAYLILKTDGAFAFKKLNDEQLITLLNLLKEKTPIAEQFALALLKNPRSDSVWQVAARRLYEFAGEPFPEKNLQEAAVARFLSSPPIPSLNASPEAIKLKKNNAPSQTPLVRSTPSTVEKAISPSQVKNTVPVLTRGTAVLLPMPRTLIYVVKEGDSLWKISKQFKVTVEKIKTYNGLPSDALKPGTVLKIPS